MANILICDDSAFTRSMIKDILKAEGHTFLDATDGDVLLRIIKEEKFDLILLDLLMPNKNGFEVLSELKTLGNGMPVIIVSADVQDGSRKKCFELGAVAFLNKPPKSLELVNEINKALKR
jgi:CheY-like chemotaxis protein